MGNDSDATNIPQPVSDGKRKFTPPGYSTKLEALMAVIRFGPEFLSDSAFKVLLFHAERSLAYNKASDAVSLTWMTNGIRKKGGGWLRCGSGLSRSGNEKGNAFLLKEKILTRTPRFLGNGGLASNEYAIDWQALSAFFANAAAEKQTPLSHQKREGAIVRGKGGYPTTKDRNRVHSSAKYKNSSHQRDGITTASPSVDVEQPKVMTEKPSLRIGDDEKPTPQNRPWTPAPELPGYEYRFAPMTGLHQGMSQKEYRPTEQPKVTTETEARQAIADLISKGTDRLTVQHVLMTMGKAFDKAAWNGPRWIPCWERVSAATKKPEIVGGGHYVGIVKAMAQEGLTAHLQRPAPGTNTASCGRCKGVGGFAPGDYCECDLGVSLRREEARKNNPKDVAAKAAGFSTANAVLASDWYDALPPERKPVMASAAAIMDRCEARRAGA